MRRLLKFVSLPFVEKRFFLKALFYLVVYSIVIKTTSFENLLNKVLKKSQALLSDSSKIIPLNRLSRLFAVASSLVPFSTCLSRALAGLLLFTSQGWETKLHIGVRNQRDTGLEAHAWLCYGCEIIIGKIPDILSYKELPLILAEDKA